MPSSGPAVTLAELTKLAEQEDKPQPLTEDQLQDYAVAMLMVLRGLPRAEKRKVLTRLRRIL